MSDVIDAVKEELASGFPSVDPATVADIASEFLAILENCADSDTKALFRDLTACEADGCLHVTALAQEYDGKRLCPACHRAQRMADREQRRIEATHGPEVPAGVRVRRAW
jgi:hypothetical protein